MFKTDSGIAFTLGPLTVRWYGILMVSGMIIAISLVCYFCKKQKIDLDHAINIALIAIPCGIIGARLYYVLFEWSYYKDHLNLIFATWEGGLAIHGSIIGGAIGIFFYIRSKKMLFRTWGDMIAPGLILAQAIGRWGNFFNQEAYGYETNLPWAMYIDGAYRHPTFLYESIWNLIGFIVLMILWQKWQNRKTGDLMAFYFIYYSVGRFVVESFRTDSLMLGPFRVAMLISLIGVVLGIILLIYNRKKPIPVFSATPPTKQAEPRHKPKHKQKKS